jgi:signal peptidase II
MVGDRVEEDRAAGPSRYGRLIRVFATTTLIFLVLDQCGKTWAFAPMRQPPGPREIVHGLFAGAQGRNNGGMLSVEGTGSTAIVWIFTTIVFVLLAMVLRWAILLDRDRWRTIDAVAGGLLLAGILGNQVDRVFLGYVRDYLVLASFPYQIFNTADLFMTIGAFVLIVSLVTKRNMRTDPTRRG